MSLSKNEDQSLTNRQKDYKNISTFDKDFCAKLIFTNQKNIIVSTWAGYFINQMGYF